MDTTITVHMRAEEGDLIKGIDIMTFSTIGKVIDALQAIGPEDQKIRIHNNRTISVKFGKLEEADKFLLKTAEDLDRRIKMRY